MLQQIYYRDCNEMKQNKSLQNIKAIINRSGDVENQPFLNNINVSSGDWTTQSEIGC